MIVCVLGRQPALAAAELESLYGAENIRLVNGSVALVDTPSIDVELGGTIKIAQVLDTLPVTSFKALTQEISRRLPQYLRNLPSEGKVKFGLSVFGIATNTGELSRAGIFLKKSIRSAGRSVRVIPNTDLVLNSAQVIHNRLTSPLGLELVLVRDGDTTIVAHTTHEQDIEAYTLRDRGRPKRDAFVGMLPPKLAQIMLHLAKGNLQEAPASGDKRRGNSQNSLPEAKVLGVDRLAGPEESERTNEQDAAREANAGNQRGQTPKGRILDPFCGTGVVLQEAALEGHAVYGTDLSPKMIDYTRANLDWLKDTHGIQADITLEQGDATSHTWQQPINAVVCESYLGRPIGGQHPTPEQLAPIIKECDEIMRGFLTNIHSQLTPDTPLCVAAPAWFTSDDTKHLPTLDDLENLGYNRIDFVHAESSELIYHREDQVVGRELLVLIRR